MKFRKQTTTEILNITGTSVHYFRKNESSEPIHINRLSMSVVLSKISQWAWVGWLISKLNR